jgi:hypothetical protein
MHHVEIPVHEHIINFLRSKGIIVDVELIGPAPKDRPRLNVWLKLESADYCKKIQEESYDFILSNTHSTYKSMNIFYKNIKPNKGFIDMEHDIFSGIPERFPKSLIIVFQDKHKDFCRRNGKAYIEARWPKLDAPTPKTSLIINSKEEAAFIGTSVLKNSRILYKSGFKKLWYKKYKSDWGVPMGLLDLPSEFTGPLGIKTCMSVFKFILTTHSSCFVEALLMGGLPILLPLMIKKENKIDDIISEVLIDRVKGLGKIKAITMDNIEQKIKKLNSDVGLFRAVRKELLNCWVSEDYFNLPPAYEVIYKYITGDFYNEF